MKKFYLTHTMKNILYFSRVCLLIILAGCATASNVEENDYAGIYQGSKNTLNRIVVDFDDGLYKIQYRAGESEWEGVGYQSGSKIVAVIRNLRSDDDAEFLNLSFPGNDQLFVVARNPQGGYIRDEYFSKTN